MNTMNIPGFTAENALARSETSHRMSDGIRDKSLGVIPQRPMSCWRTCYDISDTNNQLSECFRVCSQIKGIFGL